MRETKRQANLYSFYDHTGLERHLERMAARGWLLCRISQFIWHYRRIEPKQLTFCVCYYPRATIFDPLPSVSQEEFYDFCAHTGWTLAASSGQLQVFYNEREDPTPIETDPALEVDAIHRSAKKSFLRSHGLSAAALLLIIGLFLFLLSREPILTLANPSLLMSTLAFTLELLNCAVEVSTYFLWRRRALRAAERGEFLPTHSHVWFQWILLAAALPLAAWWFALMAGNGMGGSAVVVLAGVTLMLAAVSGIRELLKKNYASAETNRAVTMVAVVVLCYVFTVLIPRSMEGGRNSRSQPKAEDLPLSMADLLEGDFSGYTRSWQGVQSPLLGRYNAHEWPLGPTGRFPDPVYLDYEITLVKLPALYGWCRETLLHQRDDWDSGDPEDVWYGYAYVPTDPAPWGAEEAYQWLPEDGLDNGADNNQYLLFYPDRVVTISLQWDQPPTRSQMAAVGEKLGRGPL